MGELIETNVPFRWDLVTPDQLGSMLAGTTKPDLVDTAGRVAASHGHRGARDRGHRHGAELIAAAAAELCGANTDGPRCPVASGLDEGQQRTEGLRHATGRWSSATCIREVDCVAACASA